MMSPPTSRGLLTGVLISSWRFNVQYLLELLSPPVSQQLLSPLMSPHDVIISSPSQISSLSGELLVSSPVQLSSSHSKEDQISNIASQHQHQHHSSSVNKDQMMQSQCQSQPLMSPLLSPQVNHTSDQSRPHQELNIFRTHCLCLPAWAGTTWVPSVPQSLLTWPWRPPLPSPASRSPGRRAGTRRRRPWPGPVTPARTAGLRTLTRRSKVGSLNFI